MVKVLVLMAAFVSNTLGTSFPSEEDDCTLKSRHCFQVDHLNDQFLLDGKPFRYVSGSFNYFNTPRQNWRDRLRKMKAAGLNAVSTFVDWSLHQPEFDVWNWSGDADLVKFITMAQEEDLLVLLRPGPYINAERDFGGFPYWLLNFEPNIMLRTKDIRYLNYVQLYLTAVLTRVKPYLRGNGGPIIMVQIEHQYGSNEACDSMYMNKLYNIFKKIIGNKAVLYTTDEVSHRKLRCGSVIGAYTTASFGTGSNVRENFLILRHHQTYGPMVNSDFYAGSITHWRESLKNISADDVQKTLDEMLAVNGSVNIYMFYGGTNFGFTSGANDNDLYNPQITSHDYDAPLTEAGDPTVKYFRIRNVISKYLPLPIMDMPKVSPKGDYGKVFLQPILELFEPSSRKLFGSPVLYSSKIKTFEELGLPHWLVLYETNIPSNLGESVMLNATVNDRARVYVDDNFAGTLSRRKNVHFIPLSPLYSLQLKILVENQGHLSYGENISDFKGIFNVTIDESPIRTWNMTGFRLSNLTGLSNFKNKTITNGTLQNGPVFFRTIFNITKKILDTYLDTKGWGKGVAFINGNNLGRYWPAVGPQRTLYVPAQFLKFGENVLEIIELNYLPMSRDMRFLKEPDFSWTYTNDSD